MSGRTVDEVLLGFDAREAVLDRSSDWGAAWKRSALLREDVEKPLSIDRHVWSSVFDLVSQPEPGYTGLFHPLWDRLSDLEAFIEPVNLPQDQVQIVAFTRLARAAVREAADLWAAVRTEPPDLSDTWLKVGFDVGDRSATSGLLTMRSAEAAGSPERFRATWAGDLNRWHLFHDPNRAMQFRALLDRSIPEHAPFEVYGVWCAGTCCASPKLDP